MADETSDAISIPTFSDWLKILASVFQPMRSNIKSNRTMYALFSSRFEQLARNCKGIRIGSWYCLLLLNWSKLLLWYWLFETHLENTLFESFVSLWLLKAPEVSVQLNTCFNSTHAGSYLVLP